MCGRLGALKTDVLSGRDDVMEKKNACHGSESCSWNPKTHAKEPGRGPEGELSGEEYKLLLHRTQVLFPAALLGSSQGG